MKVNGKLEHHDAQPQASIHQVWAEALLATTKVLTDAYASAIHYAEAKHGDLIPPHEILELIKTAYQQMTKPGGFHGA